MPRTQVPGDQIRDESITDDDLQDTTVIPGQYDLCKLTTNQDGRITQASDGKGLAIYLALIFG